LLLIDAQAFRESCRTAESQTEEFEEKEQLEEQNRAVSTTVFQKKQEITEYYNVIEDRKAVIERLQGERLAIASELREVETQFEAAHKAAEQQQQACNRAVKVRCYHSQSLGQIECWIQRTHLA